MIEELSLEEFTKILYEIRDQPAWRTVADREMDYKDGNQLSSGLLAKMQEMGIPPATMPLIGISVESALGAQTNRRTDWRVIADGDANDPGDKVAKAFDWKLNKAEKRSRADRSCSDAYESQYSVGVGWVEVTKEQNPFRYPYRAVSTHRNEIFWDWDGYLKSPMGDDARWLVRKRWINMDLAKLNFPGHADLLHATATGWAGFDPMMMLDGGQSTDLFNSQVQERGWTIEESEWRNVWRKQVMVYEVWYRRWERVLVMKSPDGRVVEYEANNPKHQLAVTMGLLPEFAVVSRVRRAWFAGPHKLVDEPSPYKHSYFGYVPFWGFREDRTGTPYGRIRAMMYMQDNINASLSKIRWGLSSVVVSRTAGAYTGTAAQLRNEIARPDADVVLSQEHMAKPGAVFNIDRNFQLNEQQYKM
jgi:hypothetical protein